MLPQQRFDFTGIDINRILAKKPTVTWRAFAIAYNNTVTAPGYLKYSVAVIFDCDGDPVPLEISKKGSAATIRNCPGGEWAFPRYTCFHGHGWSDNAGMMVDLRTWWDIVMGCCPPDVEEVLPG